MKNFIKKLFNGDVKLWKVFWIFCIPFNILFNFIVLSLDYYPFAGVFQVYTLINLIFLCYQYFIFICLWRSSKKYNGHKIFKFLGKGFSVFYLAVLLISTITLIVTSLVPSSKYHQIGINISNKTLPRDYGSFTFDSIKLEKETIYQKLTLKDDRLNDKSFDIKSIPEYKIKEMKKAFKNGWKKNFCTLSRRELRGISNKDLSKPDASKALYHLYDSNYTFYANNQIIFDFTITKEECQQMNSN